jgi:hypothetical protein
MTLRQDQAIGLIEEHLPQPITPENFFAKREELALERAGYANSTEEPPSEIRESPPVELFFSTQATLFH